MFPYFWNSSNSAGVYPAGFVNRKEDQLQDLPEEVRESIELHQNEFRTAADINHFVHELDMKK